MRKYVNGILLVVCLVMLPMLQSCDDDEGYSIGQYAYTWATVRYEGGGNYHFDSDNYGTLYPAATDVYYYKPVDGQRVFLRFNPLYDDYQGFDLAIKLEYLYPLLTKTVEELKIENELDFGNDPVTIYKGDMWISGGYLTIFFQQNLPAREPHRVSLVRNTLVDYPDDGYVHLEFRYNTYGDTTGVWKTGAVAFNLNTIEFAEKKGLMLHINSSVNGTVQIPFNLEENKIKSINDEQIMATLQTLKVQ